MNNINQDRLESLPADQLNWYKVDVYYSNLSQLLNLRGLPKRKPYAGKDYYILLGRTRHVNDEERCFALAQSLVRRNYEREVIAALLLHYIPLRNCSPLEAQRSITKLINKAIEGFPPYDPTPIVLEPDPPAH
jgi:hypothetical protein